MVKDKRKSADWFVNWFDSSYYHLLYQHRNEEEGKRFLQGLIQALQLSGSERIIDLGCGKGRHSTYLAQQGFDVLGLDLSPSSIAHAQQQGKSSAQFAVADMRSFTVTKPADVVMNLFTSFGYFEDEVDNLKVLRAVKNALKPGGRLVLDYFHLNHVRHSRIAQEVISRGGIDFDIQRYEEDRQVVKEISFKDGGKKHHFTEWVQALSPEQLMEMLHEAGFNLEASFGNYALEPLSEKSERCILIARV